MIILTYLNLFGQPVDGNCTLPVTYWDYSLIGKMNQIYTLTKRLMGFQGVSISNSPIHEVRHVVVRLIDIRLSVCISSSTIFQLFFNGFFNGLFNGFQCFY